MIPEVSEAAPLLQRNIAAIPPGQSLAFPNARLRSRPPAPPSLVLGLRFEPLIVPSPSEGTQLNVMAGGRELRDMHDMRPLLTTGNSILH